MKSLLILGLAFIVPVHLHFVVLNRLLFVSTCCCVIVAHGDVNSTCEVNCDECPSNVKGKIEPTLLK
jgi:hypothetical protein